MDRQDIDALLIGALYGELTPADEARLSAHLESHPADRSALDGLKVARDAVKQSRIFAVQAEPPQAVSAILLQEAARRAPKKVADPERNESWFLRFVRSFASHPAMAAAAMLVVVVGVAATLYMRNGDQFAERIASAPAAEKSDQLAVDTARPEAPGVVATNEGVAVADAGAAPTGAASGSAAYDVGLAADSVAKDVGKLQAAKSEDKPEPKLAKHATPPADDAELQKAPEGKKSKGYVVVTTPDRAPKEMESAKNDAFAGDTRQIARADSANGQAAGGAGGAPAGPVTTLPATTTASAAPPPPPAAQPKAQATPAPSKTVAVAKPAPAQDKIAEQEAPPPQAAQPQAPPTNNTLLGWAKGKHADAIALVKKGDCSGAASIAASVRTRAPDYYAQNMKDDRELKSCLAYINDNADNNERSKAKAAPKRATDVK